MFERIGVVWLFFVAVVVRRFWWGFDGFVEF